MKVYIATSLGNADRARRVRDLVHDLGHHVTYDWMDAPPLHHGDPRVIQVPGLSVEQAGAAARAMGSSGAEHCTRGPGHEGPCNGLPCDTALEALRERDGMGADVSALRDRSEDDAGGVMAADVVIVILPGGHGTHTELGMALARARLANRGDIALGSPPTILLWAEGGLEWCWQQQGMAYPCVFHHDPHITLVEGDLADLPVQVHNAAASGRYSWA